MTSSTSLATYNQVLRGSFSAFLRRAFLHLEPEEPYLKNWHLDAISHRLDRVRRSGGVRLIVTVPPRSLKSITISVAWIAWMLGRNPRLRFVCASYSAELALKHARDCRSIMASDWYRRAFPQTVLNQLSQGDLTTTENGGRFSTSVGGTLTGRGGHIVVIDDPIKPDDAYSEAGRKAVIEWYTKVVSSRLNNKARGSVILVMQRVHEGDLAGHLLEAGGWDHLNLPAVAEEDEEIPIGGGRVHRRSVGDLLHPERDSREVLEHLKSEMGPSAFSAQYQQAPVPAGGHVIKADWIRYYDAEPERKPGDRVVQSWDCANKDGVTNDWSVCVTALIRKRDVYVLDVFRERLLFPDLERQAAALARRHRADQVLIEDAGGGQQLLQVLRDRQPTGMPRPIAITPKGSKRERAEAASSRIENGELLVARDAPWSALFLRELFAFPGRYDDQVDAISQLLNWDRRPRDEVLFVAPIVGRYNPVTDRTHWSDEPEEGGLDDAGIWWDRIERNPY